MKVLIPAFTLATALSGCCTVSLRPELMHVSHLTQHFGAHPTDFGYNAAMLDLHLEPVRHLMIDIAEGVVLDQKQYNSLGVPYCGGLIGPREVFSATIAYDFPLHR